MIDWRIARLIRSNLLGQILGATSATFPPNQQRVAIIVGYGLADDPTVLTSASVAFANGVAVGRITGGAADGILSTTVYGDLIQKQFTVTNESALDANVGELIMPEEYLAAGLEQFISEYAQWQKSRYLRS